jgi:hypothetical protein
MDNDGTMLGSGSSSTSASAANFVRLVSFNIPGTTDFRLDQFTCGSIPAWKRSINGPIVIDKRISLITAIFSDRCGVEAVKRLRGDDAQAFVDVLDEVPPHSSVQRKWLTDLKQISHRAE